MSEQVNEIGKKAIGFLELMIMRFDTLTTLFNTIEEAANSLMKSAKDRRNSSIV